MKFSYTFVAVCAVLALIGVSHSAFPQAADTQNNPFAKDPAAPAAGKAIFESTCSACHGAGAVGGRGPALNSGNFSRGGEDFDIFQTIKGGIAGTQMPSFAMLPSDDVWKIVTYLKSLAGHGNDTEVAKGDAKAGEKAFFGKAKCSGCHAINSRGRTLASDLSVIGLKPVGALREGVLHRELPKPGRFAPTHYAEVELKDGRKLNGLVRNEDTFRLHLQGRDGRINMLDKKDITRFTDTDSAVPKDMAKRLKPKDVENIVAFLATRKRLDLTESVKSVPAPVLPYERIAKPEPQNWTSYWGDYQGHHFSPLTQINTENVGQLQARWSFPMMGDSVLESSPIVVDGIMYVSGMPGSVYAIDAKSGLQLWEFHRKREVKNPFEVNRYNRGVAVLDGRVFFGTLDNNLIALDAHTGLQLWEVRMADNMHGYSLTGAPLALKDKIIMGMSGGEMGVRGFLDAYDPATGKRLWRFYTIPAPGEPGGDTWPGETWRTGGGATWLTGSFDPDLNLVYWAVGNPGPDFNPDMRKGDNLYTNSVIALDADTGKLKWHYQFTPNDGHDWDAQEDLVLVDKVIDGKPRKLLMQANRNGLFYVLDRVDGSFLWAKPFVKVSWMTGFDAKGRPIINPESVVTPEGSFVYPAWAATNFQAPSYDNESGVLYVCFGDAQWFVASAPAQYEPGKLFLGRKVVTPPPGPKQVHGFMALDTANGNILWKSLTTFNSGAAGLLATRGGVLFAATAESQFIAMDVKTGKNLWHFRTGAMINASPMSYAVDGTQFIAIGAGNVLYTFALPAAAAP